MEIELLNGSLRILSVTHDPKTVLRRFTCVQICNCKYREMFLLMKRSEEASVGREGLAWALASMNAAGNCELSDTRPKRL